jgi:hypothetical protein
MTFPAIGDALGKSVFSGNIAVFIDRMLVEGQQCDIRTAANRTLIRHLVGAGCD